MASLELAAVALGFGCNVPRGGALGPSVRNLLLPHEVDEALPKLC